MKFKIKRFIIIILSNILIAFVLFFAGELIIFNICKIKYMERFDVKSESLKPKFQYILTYEDPEYPTVDINLKRHFTNANTAFNDNLGRNPYGLEYKSAPIVLFGCSFAYGAFLKQNQTFSYKLARLLKRPVYNRASRGWSLQHMYFQSCNDEFYKQVPKSDVCIYIFMSEHYKRMLTKSFNIMENAWYLHYNYHNGKLYKKNYYNIISNFIDSLYITKFINHKTVDFQLNNRTFDNIATDIALAYFKETRNQLEAHWHNKINFIVVFYDGNEHNPLLRKKLEKNGFTVIDIQELTNENLNLTEYRTEDKCHPNEKAWDILTPKIAETLKL